METPVPAENTNLGTPETNTGSNSTRQSALNTFFAVVIMLVSYPTWSPFFWNVRNHHLHAYPRFNHIHFQAYRKNQRSVSPPCWLSCQVQPDWPQRVHNGWFRARRYTVEKLYHHYICPRIPLTSDPLRAISTPTRQILIIIIENKLNRWCGTWSDHMLRNVAITNLI